MTGAAVELHEPPGAPNLNVEQWKVMQQQARSIVRSKLLPKSITHIGNKERDADEVEAITLAIGLGAQALDLPFTILTVGQFDVIEGTVSPRAQLMISVAVSRGHDIWPIENDEQVAKVGAQRKGSTREQFFTYTREMARTAGHLDEWVERWVKTQSGSSYPERFVFATDGDATSKPVPEWAQKLIDAGNTKRKDNWFKYLADMLFKSVVKRAVKFVAGDAILGIDEIGFRELPAPTPPANVDAGTGEVRRLTPVVRDDPDDDVAEGEIVDDSTFGDTPPAEPATEPEPELAPVVSETWVRNLAIGCGTLDPPLDRDDRLALIAAAVGHPVASSKDVLQTEAQQVRDAFTKLKDGTHHLAQSDGGWVLVEVPAAEPDPPPEPVEYGPDEEPSD